MRFLAREAVFMFEAYLKEKEKMKNLNIMTICDQMGSDFFQKYRVFRRPKKAQMKVEVCESGIVGLILWFTDGVGEYYYYSYKQRLLLYQQKVCKKTKKKFD